MTRRPDLLATAATSAAFVARVHAPAPHPRLYSLGGSGVLLRHGRGAVAIDPYLTNTLGDREPDAPPGWRDRNAPPPVSPERLGGLSAILITHDHGDHFDPPGLSAMRALNPGVLLALPLGLRASALALGFSAHALLHPPSLRAVSLPGFTLEAIPAAHVPSGTPRPRADRAGGHHEVGYLLRIGGVSVYHAGDTVVFPELLDALRGRVDVAVLPVNGRRWSPLQPARLANLEPEEAADLAGLLGVQVVVPVHHTLLGSSAGGRDAFVAYAARRWPALRVADLEPGDGIDLVSGQVDGRLPASDKS